MTSNSRILPSYVTRHSPFVFETSLILYTRLTSNSEVILLPQLCKSRFTEMRYHTQCEGSVFGTWMCFEQLFGDVTQNHLILLVDNINFNILLLFRVTFQLLALTHVLWSSPLTFTHIWIALSSWILSCCISLFLMILLCDADVVVPVSVLRVCLCLQLSFL